MKQYYILSLKHTHDWDTDVTWWRPDYSGYTYYLKASGKYSEEQIRDRELNDGRDDIAILCDVAIRLSHFDGVGHVVLYAHLKKLEAERKMEA